MTSASILVVEDEILVAQDLQNRLEEFGYSVTTITSEEAIKTIAAPDLILVDIRLKEKMDSVEAVQALHSNFNIPIIYITATTGESAPFGYIFKPFKEKELKTAIEIALNKHQLERKLKQGEQWLTTILESIGDAVIVSDTQGTVTFMNPVAEVLTGWNQQDAFGKKITEVFNIIHTDTQNLNEHLIKQVFQENIAASISKQTVLISREGVKIPIDDYTAPIKDDKGNIMGAVLVFRDITERQQAQITRQKQIEQERLLSEMEKLHELKDDFLSTVSHELRTPMSNMKLAIQMLKSAPNPERKQLYLEILQTECNREIQLINELLDLQRLETSSYPLLLNEAVNLENWLPSLIEPFRVRTQESGQSLQINLTPELPRLVTDRASLERVIAELLNNACKYTPAKGEIILSVIHQGSEEGDNGRRGQGDKKDLGEKGEKGDLEDKGDKGDKVDLEDLGETLATCYSPLPDPNCQFPTSYIIFSINNQSEIPAAELPRIFEKFYRVSRADRWKQGGTGLGLALVQKLVEHLQGTISVESSAGWTTFTVKLPILTSAGGA